MSRTRAYVVLFLVVIAVGGCGSSDSTDATDTDDESDTSYISSIRSSSSSSSSSGSGSSGSGSSSGSFGEDWTTYTTFVHMSSTPHPVSSTYSSTYTSPSPTDATYTYMASTPHPLSSTSAYTTSLQADTVQTYMSTPPLSSTHSSTYVSPSPAKTTYPYPATTPQPLSGTSFASTLHQFSTTSATSTDNSQQPDPSNLQLSNKIIQENRPAGTVVGVLSFVEVGDGARTFRIVDTDNNFLGVAGNGPFSIDGDKLLSSRPFDFEAQSKYTVRVRASGPGVAVSNEFEISVLDVEEASVDFSVTLRMTAQAFEAARDDFTAAIRAAIAPTLRGRFFQVQILSADPLSQRRLLPRTAARSLLADAISVSTRVSATGSDLQDAIEKSIEEDLETSLRQNSFEVTDPPRIAPPLGGGSPPSNPPPAAPPQDIPPSSTPRPPPPPSDSESASGPPLAAIGGGGAGGLVLLCLLCCCSRRASATPPSAPAASPAPKPPAVANVANAAAPPMAPASASPNRVRPPIAWNPVNADSEPAPERPQPAPNPAAVSEPRPPNLAAISEAELRAPSAAVRAEAVVGSPAPSEGGGGGEEEREGEVGRASVPVVSLSRMEAESPPPPPPPHAPLSPESQSEDLPIDFDHVPLVHDESMHDFDDVGQSIPIRADISARRKGAPDPKPPAEPEADTSVCQMCLDAPRTVLCLPCRHASLCADCFELVMEGDKKCVICRAKIEGSEQGVYVETYHRNRKAGTQAKSDTSAHLV